MHRRWFQWLLNLYPPYWGTGIVVKRISPDYRRLDVEMGLRWYNRNYVGTHFGGSLYAMVDPFYMLMLMQILGPDYTIWDRAARIEFLKPGRGRVVARFRIEERLLEEIRAATAGGARCYPELEVLVVDAAGETVARVSKTLYVRRRRPGEAGGSGTVSRRR